MPELDAERPDAGAAPPGLTVRPAGPEEAVRAQQLFAGESEKPRAEAEWLVALKQKPVKRIVAALAWWHEPSAARFLIGSLPGVAIGDATSALVAAFEQTPSLAGVDLRYGRMLRPDEHAAPQLEKLGYEPRDAERVFEAPAIPAWERVERLLTRHRDSVPDTWRTESIRHHTPETAWPLIEPYRLIQPAALSKFWNTPGERGYDPDYSNVLFDGPEPLGVLLVRRNDKCLAIDIRVVKAIHPRLRSLANLKLFAHISRVATPETSTIRTLAFRADEREHRETVNLAGRMGGHEVEVRYIYTRPAAGGKAKSPENGAC